MPTDKDVRVRGVGASVAIHSAIRANCSNLYGALARPTENPVDTLSIRRGDRGVWLCVVKRLNTSTGQREVIFGHGGDFVEALINANGLIAAGRWVFDKPWSGRS